MANLRVASSFVVASALVIAAMGAACSATQNNNFTGGGGTGAGHTGTGGDMFVLDAGYDDSSSGDDAACAADTTKAEQLPLDMYIMLDRSSSMEGSSWTDVTGAIETFVNQPLTGIAVGLQFFPITITVPPCPVLWCATDAECGPGCGPCSMVCSGFNLGDTKGDSCEPTDYATPAVGIAPLPGVAPNIVAAMQADANQPYGNTPTYPALKGALDHAKSWAQSHANHVVIAVLATDGEPTECDFHEDIATIAGLAATAAAGTPKILTFVIGVGSSTGNLNLIAQQGGTSSAFKVDTNANAGQQFLDALNKIRGEALGCNYAIPMPESGIPDYGKVNVQYLPGAGGQPEIIPQVQDMPHCPANGDGWYYDDNINPSQIILCDATCAKVSADKKGEMQVLTGCATIVK